jgi:hypothetical protein
MVEVRVDPRNFSRWPDYPVLSAEHIRDARLYANRGDQIASLPVPQGGKVAEIGVWRATFSKTLVTTLRPREFLAFDIFTGHTEKEWNGQTGHELFEGLTHRQFYEKEMTPLLNGTTTMTIVEGDSRQTLRNFTDQSFDLVYVDGDHHYEAVKADAQLAVDMVKPSGFLVFNDYLLIDHGHAAYGVVPVVNDLVVNQGWRIVGYALDWHLYCDIALQRADAPQSVPARPAQVEKGPAHVAQEPSLLARLRTKFTATAMRKSR